MKSFRLDNGFVLQVGDDHFIVLRSMVNGNWNLLETLYLIVELSVLVPMTMSTMRVHSKFRIEWTMAMFVGLMRVISWCLVLLNSEISSSEF